MINRFNFLLISLILTGSCCAQLSLHSVLNKNHTSFNTRFGAGYHFKSFHLEGGLNVILKNKVNDKQGHLFKDRFKPEKPIEHLGFYVNAKWHLVEWNCFKPYVFYDFSFKRSTNVIDAFQYLVTVADTALNNTFDIYKKVDDAIGPVVGLEHHIGVGVHSVIWENLLLHGAVGIGFAHFYNYRFTRDVIILVEEGWDFAWMWQIGLSYTFPKKE